MVTSLDRFGRVVIPKPLRGDLGLRPGEALQVEVQEGGIVIKPARDRVSLVLKRGVWVIAGGTLVGDAAGVVRRDRDERTRKVMGLKRK